MGIEGIGVEGIMQDVIVESQILYQVQWGAQARAQRFRVFTSGFTFLDCGEGTVGFGDERTRDGRHAAEEVDLDVPQG